MADGTTLGARGLTMPDCYPPARGLMPATAAAGAVENKPGFVTFDYASELLQELCSKEKVTQTQALSSIGVLISTWSTWQARQDPIRLHIALALQYRIDQATLPETTTTKAETALTQDDVIKLIQGCAGWKMPDLVYKLASLLKRE